MSGGGGRRRKRLAVATGMAAAREGVLVVVVDHKGAPMPLDTKSIPDDSNDPEKKTTSVNNTVLIIKQ